MFDSSYLVKRIYLHCGNFRDCTRSFVRYFSDHLDAHKWWNSSNREWRVRMGVAWKIFKFAYVSTSLEADPFHRAELRLELLESESYLEGVKGWFYLFKNEASSLLSELTQDISNLEAQNKEQSGRKVEFLCRLAIVQAKAFQGDPQSTLQEAQKLYENLPENLKSRYFALLDQARKLVSTS